MSRPTFQRMGIVPALLGLIVLATYLTSSLGYFPGPEKLLITLFFAIGPVAIIGTLVVRRRLMSGPVIGASGVRDSSDANEPPSTSRRGLWADVGAVFLVIGFALFNLMLVVQTYTRARVHEQLEREGAEEMAEEAREGLREILGVVDLVQQGIDVSFDIFYCAGLLLIAAAMARHPDFGRFLGYSGMLIAASLLALNLGAFPHIPGETGLVDLGPVSGIWWVLVIARLMWLDRRDKRALERTAATP